MRCSTVNKCLEQGDCVPNWSEFLDVLLVLLAEGKKIGLSSPLRLTVGDAFGGLYSQKLYVDGVGKLVGYDPAEWTNEEDCERLLSAPFTFTLVEVATGHGIKMTLEPKPVN